MKKTTQITKMLLLIICLLPGVGTAQNPSGNILIIHDASGLPESTVVIDVEMQNDTPICAFQFEVPLPPGFSYATGSATLNPLRKVDHIINANTLPGTNIFRVLAFSLYNSVFNGNMGVLVSFTWNTQAQTGNYPLNLQNCFMGNVYGCNVITGTVDGILSITQSLPPLSGDSNCNGSVNVIDVLSTINHILGHNPQPFCFDNADVNQDGQININDLVGAVSIILGGF
jgi:hypothetical protein